MSTACKLAVTGFVIFLVAQCVISMNGAEVPRKWIAVAVLSTWAIGALLLIGGTLATVWQT